MEEEPFVLTPIYGRLLQALYQLQVASAPQLCRLFYSDNSIKRVKMLLRTLADHQYVQYDMTPTRTARSPYHYMLGPAGVEWLRELGCDISESLRPSQEMGKNYLFLQHTLDVNDIIVAAMLLGQRAPGYRLDSFTHERELKRNPYYTLQQGRKVPVIPDALLDFRLTLQGGRLVRLPVFLEVDRGTEERKAFQHKICAYATMMKANGHTTHYGVKRATVAVTTFQGEKRRDQLRGWTLAELHEDTSLIPRFLFTAQQPAPVPTHIWLQPCWYPVSMEAQPLALLGGGV